MYSMTITGTEKLQDKLKLLKESGVKNIMVNAVTAGADSILLESKTYLRNNGSVDKYQEEAYNETGNKEVPLGDRGLMVGEGTLARNMMKEISVQGGVVSALVYNNTIYAAIQELGGIIKPVRAKMLSWLDDQGIRHFAHEVHIPARPYCLAGALAAVPEIEKRLELEFWKEVEAYRE